MNSIRLVIANSLTFNLSVPRTWVILELIRMSRKTGVYERENDCKSITDSVYRLIESNPEISMRDVYFLTAIQLRLCGMYSMTESRSCSLIVEGLDGPEVVSNNHRYHVIGMENIDPLYKVYYKHGNNVHRDNVFTINMIPVSTIDAIINRVKYVTPKHEQCPGWFHKAVHRLSRRMNLTPDFWRRRDKKGIKDRRGFEGLIRELVPRMEQESPDWKTFLSVALHVEFPKWDKDSINNFILRTQDDFGPGLPRTHHVPMKSTKPIDPENIQHVHQSGGL